MIRLWQVWLAFAFGVAVVLSAMGWATCTALRLDLAKADAIRKGAIEENVRLALWRMDSSLSNLVAQENGRPYFLYSSFYPAERAYTRMYAAVQPNEILVPSPLLTFESPEVKLHFQIGPDGQFSSPEAPTGNMCDLASVGYCAPERIESYSALLNQLKPHLKPQDLAERLRPVSSVISKAVAAAGPDAAEIRPKMEGPPLEQESRYSSSSQMQINRNEQMSRQQNWQSAVAVNSSDNGNWNQAGSVGEGLLQPLWLDNELFLARRMQVNGQIWFQGCWLNWPAIRGQLLSNIRDLLPGARLEPVTGTVDANDTRLLASLPARLDPQLLPPSARHGTTPIQISLLIAWVALLLAAVMVGLVLRQALALSERRGTFVSAVTHELRTPLTTFRLYTDLLSQGERVATEKRNIYLETLRREADRLTHLVENVLAYARLERNPPCARAEDIALGALIDKVRARLTDRAAQAGMNLEAALPQAASEAVVHADPGAVEQILFNLVDNACKYAASATEKTIKIDSANGGARVTISVRDFGPGLRETQRLFQPFSKPAKEAACTAPGVGLGLALSRRLAREMGGELAWERRVTDGACFILTLPGTSLDL